MTIKKETTMVVMTEVDMSNIVFEDGQLRLTPYEGHAHQGIALHVISNRELVTHRALKDGKYYYIRNHYKEWYVGKYKIDGHEFVFLDDKGEFNPISVGNCYEVIVSTVKEISSDNIIPKQSIRRFVESFNKKYNKDNTFPLGVNSFDGIDLTYLDYK